MSWYRLIRANVGVLWVINIFLVPFWRGRVVETLDKWEKEFEIDIRVMLTGITVKLPDCLWYFINIYLSDSVWRCWGQGTLVIIITTFSTSLMVPAVGRRATSPPRSTSTEATGGQGLVWRPAWTANPRPSTAGSSPYRGTEYTTSSSLRPSILIRSFQWRGLEN